MQHHFATNRYRIEGGAVYYFWLQMCKSCFYFFNLFESLCFYKQI